MVIKIICVCENLVWFPVYNISNFTKLLNYRLTPIAKICNANKRMTIAQKWGGGVSTGIVDCWKLSTTAVFELPESPTMIPLILKTNN